MKLTHDPSFIVMYILMQVALQFAVSYPIMLLWNGCLVPAVEVLTEVSWLQTFGIIVMISLFNVQITART